MECRRKLNLEVASAAATTYANMIGVRLDWFDEDLKDHVTGGFLECIDGKRHHIHIHSVHVTHAPSEFEK